MVTNTKRVIKFCFQTKVSVVTIIFFILLALYTRPHYGGLEFHLSFPFKTIFIIIKMNIAKFWQNFGNLQLTDGANDLI